jgi:hypothetical protein
MRCLARMMRWSNPVTTRVPGRSRPARLFLVLVASVVLVALAGILGRDSVGSGSGDYLTKGPDVPGIGTATAPVCPVLWQDATPVNTRRGPLVPSGATEALLCSYSFALPNPMPLTAIHRITSGADDVAAYFNGLPASLPNNTACLLALPTMHAIVFGYTNGPAAVVYGRTCGWDQAGAVRYFGDIRKITGFWGVPFYQ